MAKEHERIAFLDQESYNHSTKHLVKSGAKLEDDDKTSHFFVLEDVNLSIARTQHDARIKLKAGQIGKGTGFDEIEVPLANPESADEAVDIFRVLTSLEPQKSEQFRYNVDYNGVTISLKYTETWGFHMELEVLHEGEDGSSEDADAKIQAVADELGVQVATDEELIKFREQWEATKQPRGEYTPEQFRKIRDALFQQAARGMTPEQQRMDDLTLSWLRDSLNYDPRATSIEIPHEVNQLLDRGIDPSWYTRPDRADTLHGDLHLSRVAIFAAAVACEQGMSPTEQREAALAGLLHDIRRINDKEDPEHGTRSAEWLAGNTGIVMSHFGLDKDEVNLDAVIAAIAEHKLKPEDPTTGPLSQVLQAADALDRYRLPKESWWPDFNRVRLQPSDQLRHQAMKLVVETEAERLSAVTGQNKT